MSRLLGIVGIIALGLITLAQAATLRDRAPSSTQRAQVQTVASGGALSAVQAQRGNDWERDGVGPRIYAQRGYHGMLAPEWQRKFDSYYQRWLQYRATNNQSEMRSMESRMQDIMVHYKIPTNVPFDQVASPGIGGNQAGYGQWRGRLSKDDQRRFDSYYSRWLNYRRTNNRSEVESMEKRMRDVMSHNNIPSNVPFDQIASANAGSRSR